MHGPAMAAGSHMRGSLCRRFGIAECRRWKGFMELSRRSVGDKEDRSAWLCCCSSAAGRHAPAPIRTTNELVSDNNGLRKSPCRIKLHVIRGQCIKIQIKKRNEPKHAAIAAGLPNSNATCQSQNHPPL
eukprot:scaffold8059_cov315-Pinguiococcus_pyrenoidosus.AAC.6